MNIKPSEPLLSEDSKETRSMDPRDAIAEAWRRERGEVSGANARLNRHEAEIARLIAQGYTNQEIAEALSLSDTLVRHHMEHLLLKCEARTRAELQARLRAQTDLPPQA
jgi:DNA-binding NarL/FixJ family response regulator